MTEGNDLRSDHYSLVARNSSNLNQTNRFLFHRMNRYSVPVHRFLYSMAADVIVLITTETKTKSSSGGTFLLCQLTKSKTQLCTIKCNLLLAKAARTEIPAHTVIQ